MTIIETHSLVNSMEGIAYQFDKMNRNWSFEIDRNNESAAEIKQYNGLGTSE